MSFGIDHIIQSLFNKSSFRGLKSMGFFSTSKSSKGLNGTARRISTAQTLYDPSLRIAGNSGCEGRYGLTCLAIIPCIGFLLSGWTFVSIGSNEPALFIVGWSCIGVAGVLFLVAAVCIRVQYHKSKRRKSNASPSNHTDVKLDDPGPGNRLYESFYGAASTMAQTPVTQSSPGHREDSPTIAKVVRAAIIKSRIESLNKAEPTDIAYDNMQQSIQIAHQNSSLKTQGGTRRKKKLAWVVNSMVYNKTLGAVDEDHKQKFGSIIDKHERRDTVVSGTDISRQSTNPTRQTSFEGYDEDIKKRAQRLREAFHKIEDPDPSDSSGSKHVFALKSDFDTDYKTNYESLCLAFEDME